MTRRAFTARSITRYIVLNEPRSGSSWLQEISQMHPGIKVQFELDLDAGDAALACKQCLRPWTPDSKRPALLPAKLHPPLACGMTTFASDNRIADLRALARRAGARLVVLLRRDHLAQAVSSYLHFNRDRFGPDVQRPVDWDAQELRRAVAEHRQAYARLLRMAAESGRPAHLVFYEDLVADAGAVWRGLQAFLGVPAVAVSGIAALERRSTSKPPAHYLRHLELLQKELAGTPLGDALRDGGPGGGGGTGAAGGLGAEFARVCRVYGRGGLLSWRLHTCEGGEAVGWADDGPTGARREA